MLALLFDRFRLPSGDHHGNWLPQRRDPDHHLGQHLPDAHLHQLRRLPRAVLRQESDRKKSGPSTDPVGVRKRREPEPRKFPGTTIGFR